MEEIRFKQSPKRSANKIIAWLCSICYLVFGIILVVSFMTKTFTRLYLFFHNGLDIMRLEPSDLVLMLCMIFIVVFLIFSLNFYEWALNPVLIINKDMLTFKTDDVIAALGRSTTVNKIIRVDSYKEKKNSIIIYGDMTVQEPLKKPSKRNSIEIVGLYDEEDKRKVLSVLKEFMNHE